MNVQLVSLALMGFNGHKIGDLSTGPDGERLMMLPPKAAEPNVYTGCGQHKVRLASPPGILNSRRLTGMTTVDLLEALV